MPEKSRLSIHRSFVSDSGIPFTDGDGEEKTLYRVRMPRDLIVNGTPVGGATFLARYCYENPEAPNQLVFTFKPGDLVELSLPIKDSGGNRTGQYFKLPKKPEDIQRALDENAKAYRAKQFARSRDRVEVQRDTREHKDAPSRKPAVADEIPREQATPPEPAQAETPAAAAAALGVEQNTAAPLETERKASFVKGYLSSLVAADPWRYAGMDQSIELIESDDATFAAIVDHGSHRAINVTGNSLPSVAKVLSSHILGDLERGRYFSEETAYKALEGARLRERKRSEQQAHSSALSAEARLDLCDELADAQDTPSETQSFER